MNKDKWIALSLGSIMVISIAVIGVFIWKANVDQKPKKQNIVNESSSSGGGGNLEVTNNNGLGAGIEDKAQSLGAKTSDNTSETPKKENFTDYEKYKNDKTALFGEIKAGTGEVAKENDKLGIYYKGYLTNGQIFDNQWPAKAGDKPKPFEFVLGTNSVIAGLQQGIAGMKVGGVRRIIIPPAVGYGEKGQGSIPPDSVLVMDVELLSVTPNKK